MAAPKEKLLAAPEVSHGTIPMRLPQPFLQKKQQDMELAESVSARATVGSGRGMGSSQGRTGMEGQQPGNEGAQKSSTVPG